MFSGTPPGNSMSFLINPLEILLAIFSIPTGNSISSTPPPCFFFSGISHCKLVTIATKQKNESQQRIYLAKCFSQPAVPPLSHGILLVIKQPTCKSLLFQSSYFEFFNFFFHKDQQQFQDYKSSYNLP